MPYLFCPTHGKRSEASSLAGQDETRALGECVLIVEGRLISGGWLCDSCNAPLDAGQRAWLHAAFPAHLRDNLADYDFDFERNYFAMTPGDRVAAYGAPWPDDSLRPERVAQPVAEERPLRRRLLSATELMTGVKS